MAQKGAQPGNKNAVKGTEWTEALRYALQHYEDKDNATKRGQALRRIGKKVVELALNGDKDAYREIGDRFDGKSVAFINAEVDTDLTVNIVQFDGSNPPE